eukprot:SAG31_NODE_2163_length_6293_cov_2.483532_6_plen_110_part_00
MVAKGGVTLREELGNTAARGGCAAAGAGVYAPTPHMAAEPERLGGPPFSPPPPPPLWISAGHEIAVHHLVRTQSGTVRARTDLGWTTALTKDGKALLREAADTSGVPPF